MHFDHVGVATDDAADLAALFADLFETEIVHEEEFDGMRVVFIDVGGDNEGPYLELLEPLTDEGSIARFLERDGPGIHHVALATDSVERALSGARSLGLELVDEEPRPGAWGHEVAFLHPGSTGGVLVEFVEH